VHPHRESRRTIARLGFGVLEDGTTFPLSIVEISYSGCKIETQIALFPGVELRISALGGRATVAARVQWHREGCAGIEFLPDAPAARVKTPRAHDRRAVDASVMLRQTGRRHYQTQLFDLTPAGSSLLSGRGLGTSSGPSSTGSRRLKQRLRGSKAFAAVSSSPGRSTPGSSMR
jgi:hypothetical protein